MNIYQAKVLNNLMADRIKDNSSYINIKFDSLNNESMSYSKINFENCNFTNCHFKDSVFNQCRFIECSFKSCHLDFIQIKNSSFINTEFLSCHMKGINWTQARWPLINLDSPIVILGSNISYSSFFELQLAHLMIEKCKAHEVDFRGCDLSKASFKDSDLEKSIFLKTNLKQADFTAAINYYIDPTSNDIKQAKFELPEALNLLQAFDILII